MTVRRSLILMLVGILAAGLLTIPRAQDDPSPQSRPPNVPLSPWKICPLLVGEEIPRIKVVSVDGAPFDLIAAVIEKPTILIFYRGGW